MIGIHRRLLAAALLAVLGPSCATTTLPWEHPSIAQVAPEPALPLTLPSRPMRADKGSAPANYPSEYTAAIKADGKILFPQGTVGHVKDAAIYAGDSVVATLSKDGEVSGKALKHRYRFNPDGDLLDSDGHGVRVSPAGGVRAIGGPWHYQDVMVWTAEGGEWHGEGWRIVAIVSLIVIENLLPNAIR